MRKKGVVNWKLPLRVSVIGAWDSLRGARGAYVMRREGDVWAFSPPQPPRLAGHPVF